MAAPQINSEDPRTEPAQPEVAYDKMVIDHIQYANARLLVNLTRTDADGNLDPQDDGLSIRFRDFDGDLARASNLETAWNNMLRGLAALYREERLLKKIEIVSAAGGDTTELEAALASVRVLLGVS